MSKIINQIFSSAFADGSKWAKGFADKFNSNGSEPISKVFKETYKDITGEAFEKATKKGPSKKAFGERGLHGVKKALNEDKTIGEAFKHAYTKDDNKRIAASTIMGSYAAVNGVARVASGGGLYKDRNGNTNIVGIPLI